MHPSGQGQSFLHMDNFLTIHAATTFCETFHNPIAQCALLSQSHKIQPSSHELYKTMKYNNNQMHMPTKPLIYFILKRFMTIKGPRI